jgi:hypothetical protein
LGLSIKQQGSRLHEKLEALQLIDTEIKLATDLIWEDNKPAKLQFFAWQVASGSLFTGSRAIHLGFPSECKRCGSGFIETTEHCMSSCSHARKVWHWAQNIREALGLTRAMAWRELASGIKPGTRLHNGYQHHQEPPQAAWDVLRVALLWRIRCARCRTVFSREPCSIVEVCQLAWKDTIYAGMARLMHLKTSSPSLQGDKLINISKAFNSTWCRNEVFCAGSFSAPRWRLSPAASLLPMLMAGQPGPL